MTPAHTPAKTTGPFFHTFNNTSTMASLMRKAAVAPAKATRTTVKASASLQRVAQAAGVAVAGFSLALSANAANVKLGADSGALVFEPATVTIKAGDSVTWTNNAGFPHNIVFDEDAVPAGVNADALSHDDYLNAPGESYTAKFDTAGEYGYFCEPHQGAGMVGKVIVQ